MDSYCGDVPPDGAELDEWLSTDLAAWKILPSDPCDATLDIVPELGTDDNSVISSACVVSVPPSTLPSKSLSPRHAQLAEPAALQGIC